MKSLIYCITFLMSISVTNAVTGQNINTPENFPDPNFRAAVEEFMGVEAGGAFTAAQAAANTGWFDQCNGQNIADLSGIGFFTGIEGLDCGDNQLTELDISNNTALSHLICSNNQISHLDLSHNTALTTLYCWTNQLVELDVSSLIVLQNLLCEENQLPVLDVSQNPDLVLLYCGDNNLSTIDISNNTQLEVFYCNESQLTEIDLSNNPALTEVGLDNNQLSNLDMTSNAALEILYCRDNSLTALDVSRNINLTQLYCPNNHLTQLDISNQALLTYLRCSGNQLTSLDLSNSPNLTHLYCQDNQLFSLNISNNPALIELECGNNQLSNLNVSNNTALTLLNCRDMPLPILDLSQNTALTTLICIDDQLIELDLSNNTALEHLDCWSNQLTSLDLSHNPALTILNCNYNQIQTLDVSQNTELSYLNCYNNQLTDLSNFVANAGITGDDTVDIRQNDLSFDDWQNVLTLRNRLNEPTYYSWGEIESGFSYSPQKGFDPYDFSDITPTPTYTFTPEPTNTPAQPDASPTPTHTPTPTQLPPTSTPTPPTQQLYVYDDSSDSSGDLSGQTDYDAETNRNISIVWNAPQWDAANWHVYIRKGLGGSKYLGQTGDGGVSRLDWSPLSSNIADEFSGGPDFNSFYTFRAIRIDDVLDAYDYIDMTAPVGYNLEGGNPVSISQPEMPNLDESQVVIYDDILGGEDLAPMGSTGFDVDYADSRAIQIAWNFDVDASTANEYHVLVKVDDGGYQLLGQTYNGNITYFWWTKNLYFRTFDTFMDGPQDGHSYQFMIILKPLTGNTRNLVSGVINYSVTDAVSAGSNQSQCVFIYDEVQDATGDLTGSTDFDSVDDRNLTIAWDAEQDNATDWHIYMRKGFGGSKFLGRTASGDATRLNWTSGTPNLADEFASGPNLNASYIFRVIRIDGQLGSDDYFDMSMPVGFNLEGGNAVSLAQPELPNLNSGQVAVYDDILGGNDLAPMGSTGSDTDNSSSRAIQIAWNFGRDASEVNEYHILVSVDGANPTYLGQTYTSELNYFWWSPNQLFRTHSDFADGPQDGHTYQFTVVLSPLLTGERMSLKSGTLYYYVNDN